MRSVSSKSPMEGMIASQVSQQESQTHPRLQMARVRAPTRRAVDEVLRVRRVRLALLDGRGGGEAGDEDGEDDGGEAHDY